MERRQFLQSTVLSAPATMLGIAPPAAATTPLCFLQANVMSEPIRPYEPLTSENATLILIDHQVGLMTGVRDYSTGELKHNVVALAKAATLGDRSVMQRDGRDGERDGRCGLLAAAISTGALCRRLLLAAGDAAHASSGGGR